jgi:hypothetical protein
MTGLDFLSNVARGWGEGVDGRCKFFATSLCSYFGSAELLLTINTVSRFLQTSDRRRNSFSVGYQLQVEEPRRPSSAFV